MSINMDGEPNPPRDSKLPSAATGNKTKAMGTVLFNDADFFEIYAKANK
jgi:hypothetical protein